MADNDIPETPDEEQMLPQNIEQHAGDHAIQVGQVSGNVTFQKVFQIISAKAVLIIVISLALTASGFMGWRYVTQKPARMTGDFNIAVAKFYELGADGKEITTEISSRIGENLTTSLKDAYNEPSIGLKVEIAHDQRMPIIPADGWKMANQLAAEIHADVVVYGRVDKRGNEAVFSPMFYIANTSDSFEIKT